METVVDLLVCLIVLPGLISVFPVEEWIGWKASDVIVYILWVYLCWYLVRFPAARFLTGERKKVWRGVVLLFLLAVLTFLMSLRQVAFPQELAADRPPRLYLYQQAVWALFAASSGLGLTTGLLSRKIRTLQDAREKEDERLALQSAVSARASEAVAGETVTVKADYRDVTVPLAAIQYIEARNNYACIHLDHQDDVISQITLKTLLEMLPEGKFVRIHRSFVVPVHRIESRKATSVKLIGVDNPLPVGRAHKENLK